MSIWAALKSKLPSLPENPEKGFFRRLRYYCYHLLKIEGDARWIAGSFGIGVFISLTPFYGFHTATVIVLIFVMRLHPLAALIGSMANPPWFAPFFYGAGFMLGELLLGQIGTGAYQFPKSFAEMKQLMLSWEGFYKVILPFCLGSTILSMITGYIAYLLMFIGIRKFRMRKSAQNNEKEALSETIPNIDTVITENKNAYSTLSK